ncbi:MAG: type II toxin-antitoxin system Phd/YefM family antitoxin [Gemmatimonadaceae bacterium]
MKAVGVKELKARLSSYLRAVRAGETLLVTDRDVVIAEIRPSARRPAPPDTLEEAIEALAETGEVTRASRRKQGWTWAPPGLGLAPGTAEALLDDLRTDRPT